jgi:hypothetical protein
VIKKILGGETMTLLIPGKDHTGRRETAHVGFPALISYLKEKRAGLSPRAPRNMVTGRRGGPRRNSLPIWHGQVTYGQAEGGGRSPLRGDRNEDLGGSPSLWECLRRIAPRLPTRRLRLREQHCSIRIRFTSLSLTG